MTLTKMNVTKFVTFERKGLLICEREQAKQIIDSLPEYKVRKVLLFLKGVQFDNDMDNDTYSDELITE